MDVQPASILASVSAKVLVPGPAEDWDAVGHTIRDAWLEIVGRFGAWALALIFLTLLVRAFLRRHRYRAVDVLDTDDLAAVQAALTETESKTVGEILPVVVERSDRHPAAHWIAALVTVLLTSSLLTTRLPWDRPELLMLCQLAFGAFGYLASLLLPDFQRAFVRERRATEMAEEQAFQEFYGYGLHQTEHKTGVLLFVSLLEHRVIVMADEGINAKVDNEQWKRVDEAILEGIIGGSLRAGLTAGIAMVGRVLDEHFGEYVDKRNEIQDRVIIRRE